MRILDELGAELDRAVRADETPAARRRHWWRTPLVAVIATLGVGGGAFAGTQLLGQGDPVPGPHAIDVPSEAAPLAASVTFGGRPVADPDGAPPWEVRLARSKAGERCVAIGQIVDRRFGLVGLDRIFRPLPVGAGDACTAAPRGQQVVAGARNLLGRGRVTPKTIVSGLAGPGVKSVAVRSAAGTTTVALGRDRSFLAVLRGAAEELRPAVLVRTEDGAERRIGLAESGRDEVSDTEGGTPWAIEAKPFSDGGRAPAGLTCAQATRPGYRSQVPGDQSLGPLTPNVCGFLRRVPLFALVRRFVPEKPRDGTPFGLHPARTLMYGAVAGNVASLRVEGAGPPVEPRVFRPHGGFLVVLDGRVDPRKLVLAAALRDGRVLRLRGSQNLRGERGTPIAEPPVPAWRSVASQAASVPRGFVEPDASSVRTGAPVSDPAGGPKWAVRAFTGGQRPGVRYIGPRPARFACYQVGPLVDGRLLAPGTTRPLTLADEGDAYCSDDEPPRTPARFNVQVIAYADDAGGYEPRLSRIAVSGMAPHATRVELLGRGAPRPLHTSGPGGFLVLLPGTMRGRIAVRAKFANGRTYVSRPRGSTLTAGSSDVDARAPDPDGGPPWAVSSARGTLRYGRLVLGRFAFVSPDDNSVRFGESGSAAGIDLAHRPLFFGIQPLERRTPGLTEAQVQRRTLPGRTTIYGTARSDVIDLELRTPRDVRTLRPHGSGRGFIAVYDGTFNSGQVVLTARLRSGRRVTYRQPVWP